MIKPAIETDLKKMQAFANDACVAITGIDEVLEALILAGEVTPNSLGILRNVIELLQRDHPDYL
jgi:hypothetical protein